MRRILTIALLCAACAFSASALDFDFGGSIGNISSPSAGSLGTSPVWDMDQRNTLALWAGMYSGTTLSLVAQGSYTFTLDRPYLFNPDVLKLDWRISPAVQLTAGRFLFRDSTGLILLHTLDGLQTAFDLSFMSIRAGAGYSGFLLKPVSTIIMSRSDAADLSIPAEYLAARRLVEKLEVTFPQLLLRQQLTLSALAQQDLRWGADVIQPGQEAASVSGLEGGKLDSEYFTLGVSGPIAGPLYWDGFFSFSAGRTLSYVADPASGTGFSWQYEPIYAFLTGASFKLYFESFLSSRLEIRGIWSSGDADNLSFQEGNTAGASNLFVPISVQPFGIAFTPQLGNLVILDAGYSVKPFAGPVMENLMIKLESLSYLRPTLGAISLPGVDPASASLYLGTEADLILDFRPTSDLGLSLGAGLFLPSAAFTGPAAEPSFAGRLQLSFAF